MLPRNTFTSFPAALFLATLGAVWVFISFSGVLQADFLMWDDDIAILYNNNLIKDNIWWAFSELDTTQRYNPLMFLTWSLIYHAVGFNPFWFHLTSVLFHSFSTVCLYFSLRELIAIAVNQGQLAKPSQFSLELASISGALLWGLHPLRVEVVGLAATTTYCQSAFFLMTALLCYLKAHRTSQPDRYYFFFGGTLISYVCSLLTYPLGITFFLLFLWIDLFLLKRVDFSDTKIKWLQLRTVFLEKAFLGLPAVVITLAAILIRHRPSSVWESPVSLADFGIIERAMQAFYILIYFLWKPFYPVNLSPLYMTLTSFDPYSLPFVTSLLLVIGISAVCVCLWKRLPMLAGLWICYITLQFPFLGFFEHPHFPSDRYSLLSSLVVSALAAVVIMRVMSTVSIWCVALCIISLVTTLGWMSAKQVGVWKNSEVLFSHIYRQLGDDPYRIEILGRLVRFYQQSGEKEKIAHTLQRILALKPGSILAHRQLAAIYSETGKYAQALPHYKSVLTKEPSDFTARYDYGMALLKIGRKTEATEQFQYAETLKKH